MPSGAMTSDVLEEEGGGLGPKSWCTKNGPINICFRKFDFSYYEIWVQRGWRGSFWGGGVQGGGGGHAPQKYRRASTGTMYATNGHCVKVAPGYEGSSGARQQQQKQFMTCTRRLSVARDVQQLKCAVLGPALRRSI